MRIRATAAVAVATTVTMLVGGAVLHSVQGSAGAKGTTHTIVRQARERSLSSPTQSSSPNVPVPGLMMPPKEWSVCSQNTTLSAPAPDARSVARLPSPPAGLSDSLTAEFPPCAAAAPSAPVAGPTGPSTLSFQVEGELQYEGSDGSVTIVTAVPSPAAVQQGVYLGDPAGSLADGTTLWSQTDDTNPSSVLNELAWYDQGVIVRMTSSMPLSTLQSLARNVVIS